MVPLAIGVGLGLAGQGLNYMGGRREAKRRKRALGDYERTSGRLYEEMAMDAWKEGQGRQRATGRVLEGLPATMGAPRADAPDVSTFMPEQAPDPSGLRDEAYRTAMASAGQPTQQLNQARVAATQTGMNRGDLERALDALGFSSNVESMANDPAHRRLQWQKKRQLEEARAQLERILGSTGNSTRNLQLLGSLLNTAGQGAMMYGAMGGSGPPGTAGMPRDAANAAFFNSVR